MNKECKNLQLQSALTKKLLTQPSLFQPIPNHSVHPHFVPSTNNLNENILGNKDTDNNKLNKNDNNNNNNNNNKINIDKDNIDVNNNKVKVNNKNNDNDIQSQNSHNEPLTITDEDGVSRYLSTSKMSSRGPVNKEFTLKGSTPSGKPRLFVCAICTRAFARQEHLKRHERSHTKEKPFTCNICSRKFSRRDLLLRHSTKLHAGAADVIPRLRKRSIKHMKKEEIERMKKEEEELKIKRIKSTSSNGTSNSISTSNSLLTATTSISLNSTNDNISKKHSQNDNNNNNNMTSPLPNVTPNLLATNNTTRSLLGKVLKSLTPNSSKNSSNSTSISSVSTKSINSSSTLSHVSKTHSISNYSKKRRVSSTDNSLILDHNNPKNINTLFTTNNNDIANDNNNYNNIHKLTNNKYIHTNNNDNQKGNNLEENVQLPLYPLNDNQFTSVAELSDLNSSLATFDNFNENENNFDRFNELQSNAYNYYRRASFSAMSGVNYALTNPEPYASETVEFSTPQFNSLEDEQEKWLNSFSENNEINKINDVNNKDLNEDIIVNNNINNNNKAAMTEIQQLNNFINSKTKQQDQLNHNYQQNFISDKNSKQTNNIILNGYSFYDDDTISITESLFKTRLYDHSSPIKNNNTNNNNNSGKLNKNNKSNTIIKNTLPFKPNSPIMKDEILNLNLNSNNINHQNKININNSNNSKFDIDDNSKILRTLFEKISNLNSNININPNINVLDKLNLEQLEKMSHMGDSKIPSNNYINKPQNLEKINSDSDFFDNFFDNNDNKVMAGVTKKVISWQETLFSQPISDLQKLNEMHISKTYGIPQGYSFYGGDESSQMNRSNSNGLLGAYIDNSLSSEATISPVLLEHSCSTDNFQSNAMDIDDINQIENLNQQNRYPNDHNINNISDNRQNQNNSHINHNHQNHHKRYLTFEEEFNESVLSSYSQAFLFTENISKLIKKGLSDYPFFGTPTPELLSNDVLNLYVDQFVSKFLAHHPFIHKGVLNEHWIIKEAIESAMKSSINSNNVQNYNGSQIKLIRDDYFIENFKVSIVCLPLLIATIGAVVSNKKHDAALLYEISRRCIHVYLESRKNLSTCGGDSIGNNNNNNNNTVSNSPLWLIQSLTLSVIYGLFADEEISLAVIIRQVHALNALIKSSRINELKTPDQIDKDYHIFINYESTIRTVHMIFHVSTLLSTLYNIVPSLNISDLNIDLPAASLLWESSSAEEYYKLIENFDFHAKNFKNVIKEIFKIDLSKIDPKTGLIDSKNFLLNNHVSEFGLICLQNGLHQLVYFKQLSIEKSEGVESINNNIDNIGKCIIEDLNEGNDISIEKIRGIGQIWDLLVNACILYNKSSEVYNDCKILNHYLNLKLSSIISLNKIKESVWLKSFSDINEQYIACFNYGDNELKDQNFQNELIQLIENSINILKLVFFNEDTSLMGSISPSYMLKNETIKKLDDIYSTPPPFQRLDSNDSINTKEKEKIIDSYNYNSLNKINLNVLHKLSIDSQILFDVILIIVKFLINYENFFKIRMKFDSLTNYTFLQHFELNSSIFLSEKKNDNNDDNKKVEDNEEALQKFDKVLFKYYLKFFKIFLNLEQFLKHNYNYEDFETGEELVVLNDLYPNTNSGNENDLFNRTNIDDFENKEIDRVLRESHQKLREEERTLNEVVSDELVVFHDRDLIMSELINFKLPFKFLKVGGFLFGFIYDKNFKFVNFKHLSDVLFHLRVFLESKDEYV